MGILSLITSDILAGSLQGLDKALESLVILFIILVVIIFLVLYGMFGVTAFTIKRIQNRKSIDVDRAELQESIAKSSNKNKAPWWKVTLKVILYFGIGCLIAFIAPYIAFVVLVWIVEQVLK